MNKCANPFCENEVKVGAKFCSSRCRSILDQLNNGTMQPEDNFEEWQSGSIHLPNGIEIRNDAMGKEIAGNIYNSYVERNRAR